MSRYCQITHKKPLTGNTVSHANNKCKRRFLPNLKNKRLWLASENRYVKLTISARGLRIVNKVGVEAVVKKLRHQGQHI